MRTKLVLLQSVSAIATVAATNGHALAQVITPPAGGYTYNVGGGLLFSPAESSLAGLEEDKMGLDTDLDDFDNHFGYNASFSVGKQIDNNWDVRFGGSINKLLDSTGSLTWSSSFYGAVPYGGAGYVGISGFSSGREAFGFGALDFEVGYTPVLTETQSVRLFAGVRGLHFGAESEFSSGYGVSFTGLGGAFGSYDIFETETLKTEFFGAGPRLGVSAAHRFEGSNFGVSGTVAGALLFGRQTTTISGTSGFSSYSTYDGASGNTSSFSSSFNTNKMVVDLEAKGGLDYYLDDSTALTVGYKAELLQNVGPDDDMSVRKLVHGPFLSLTGSFD